MSQRVIFVQGGGVGFDQEASVRRLLSVLQVPIDLERHLAGRAAIEQGSDPLPESLLTAIREAGWALKSKLLAPVGVPTPTAHGPRVPANFNVELRRKLGAFAAIRPVHNLAGLPSRFTGVNFVIVREITEDLYASSEHEIVPGVGQSFKVVTEAACLRFFRYVFDLARELGRPSVHCIHKANILKLADGLYLECFRKIARDYPEITPKEMIVDNTCMQLVSKPQQFDMLATGNLYGDLLSDLGAGLVGGISATSAMNVGPGIKVFEAVYGAGYEQVPPGKANPLPLILPTIEMLRSLGHPAEAERLLKAVEAVLTSGSPRPIDLGGSAGTEEFTEAIVTNLKSA